MKLLVIRFSSIGDIVLTSPVVRCLKIQLRDVEVHFLVKPKFKATVVNNPYIDKIHLLQDNWQEMIDSLKQEQFDYIVDLHHNLRTLRVKKALKVPAFSFPKLNTEKFLYTQLKLNVMPRDVHVVDRYMQTVASLGVRNDGAGMDYFIAPEEEVPLTDIPFSHSAGYVGIVIGASYFTKKLPVPQLQELCRRIEHPIILLGGPEDTAEGAAVASVDPIKVYNACGKFSLNESADLVRKAKLVVAHDTGLMHIAAALKKEVIAVWGSTVPLLGVEPYYGSRFLERQARVPFVNFKVEKLWCQPCTKMGRHRCPLGHFRCMNDLSMPELAGLVHQRLGKG